MFRTNLGKEFNKEHKVNYAKSYDNVSLIITKNKGYEESMDSSDASEKDSSSSNSTFSSTSENKSISDCKEIYRFSIL